MPDPKVVITGMGWVAPLGHDVPSIWAALMAGKSGVGKITRFAAETFKTNFAAEVKDYRLEDHLPNMEAHRDAGRHARFALGAATQAFRQSGLDKIANKINRRRFGMYLGSGEGTLDFDHYAAAHVGSWNAETRKVDGPAWHALASKNMTAPCEIEQEANMTLAHLAWEFGLRGPSSNCLTACAASIQAIGEASEVIRRGDADIMFAGGAHSMIHPLGVTGFIRLTALSARSAEYTSVPRPFDQTRDGFVMGEGSGMLVLETEEHARARGANILAEIAGYGSSADSFRITDMHPQGDGPRAAMRAAMTQAGIDPTKLDASGRPAIHYISAHGTGTKENDKIETAAVKALFGDHAKNIPISSIKSMLGHLIAAAGVSNVISSVMAIRTGWVPPTINYSTPDAGLDLDYVPNHARDLSSKGGVNACLCNAYGFGGQNDCVVVRGYK